MADTAHPHRWRRIWLSIPAAILLIGVAGAIALALLRHSVLRAQEREAFHATAADVSAAVAGGLHADTDSVRMLGILVAIRPHLTATQFQRWYDELHGGNIPAVLRTAVDSHPRLTLALYHRDPLRGMQLIGSAGPSPSKEALTSFTELHTGGTWSLRVQGTVPIRGLSADGQEILMVAVGVLIAVLLATLAFILLRSRERALGLADERSGQLRHQALHDAVTGLPNRMLALNRAEHMMAQARQRHGALAAFCIDLDRLGDVNDTLGHSVGDHVLRVAASRLLSVVRETDTVARYGGDEFVVLVEQASPDATPELLAERLHEVLRLPYQTAGEHPPRTLTLTASIGVAHGVYDGAEELLACAGIALAEAKARGQDRYVVFEPSMRAARDRLELKGELAGALQRGELSLVYQPIFELRSRRMTGVEALLRWRHRVRGLIRPDEFIAIAETSGAIVPIGRWVLVQACRQAAAWRARGHTLGVSVNVSARQFDSESLVDDVGHALREARLAPDALMLEITETVIMRDTQANARRLQQLKRLGVRLAIDDFGTGHSSLAYLRQFPVDVLKIDRAFVTGIAESRDSAAMIHILVELGKTLGLGTLAEGIEDRAQLDVLLREGCGYGQGFLFQRPLAAEALGDLLEVHPLSPLASDSGLAG